MLQEYRYHTVIAVCTPTLENSSRVPCHPSSRLQYPWARARACHPGVLPAELLSLYYMMDDDDAYSGGSQFFFPNFFLEQPEVAS
jgi:hypothetical protein